MKNKTFLNLLLALGACLIFVIFVIIAVPRDNNISYLQSCDYIEEAKSIESDFIVAAPELGDYWRANSCEYAKESAGYYSWYIGFIIKDSYFISFKQAFANKSLSGESDNFSTPEDDSTETSFDIALDFNNSLLEDGYIKGGECENIVYAASCIAYIKDDNMAFIASYLSDSGVYYFLYTLKTGSEIYLTDLEIKLVEYIAV